jgi:protein-tyrosine phosphatase
MVCLGNICRSPMAEGWLRKLAEERRMNLNIDSAGTGNWHVGEAPDHRAIQSMADSGINISNLKARQLKKEDFSRFDYILVMDSDNYRDSNNVAPDQAGKDKVELLTNFLHPGENRRVPDPYWGGADQFNEVNDLIRRSCEAFLNHLND